MYLIYSNFQVSTIEAKQNETINPGHKTASMRVWDMLFAATVSPDH